jgi:hypothetical protein
MLDFSPTLQNKIHYFGLFNGMTSTNASTITASSSNSKYLYKMEKTANSSNLLNITALYNYLTGKKNVKNNNELVDILIMTHFN